MALFHHRIPPLAPEAEKADTETRDSQQGGAMSRSVNDSPLLMPVLGRGRHRTPKSGACFMEFASYLAGERWSDHPACAHPALASLARLVNDCSSDAARGELVALVPSVVGLLGDGRRSSLAITARAIAAALPVASIGRQRALAAGAIRCLPLLEGASAALVWGALAEVPEERAWAERFVPQTGPLDQRMVDRMCDAIIRTAVIGIGEACVSDPDARLRALLETCIRDLAPMEVAVAEEQLVAAR
jgi:hypothetical protein